MSDGTRQMEVRNRVGSPPETVGAAAGHRRHAILGTTGHSPDGPASGNFTMVKVFVGTSLALWLGGVVFLGGLGEFVVPPGTAPYPIALGFGLPLIIFYTAFSLSARFRDFLLASDLPLLTAIQAWRFAGFGFIALYVHRVLPGTFAWPAGLGDMAIGLTAPWLALALLRRPSLATSRLFVVWNLLGILDLIVAVSDGALNQVLATGAAGEISIAPMAQLPLLLIPAYLVPLFAMLHLTGLLQSRRMTQTLSSRSRYFSATASANASA
jgi:hypothetical protein